MPLSIRQLTRTPLYLVLFYVSLNSSNTRSSLELRQEPITSWLRKKLNLISNYFLESDLSGIWRPNLNLQGRYRCWVKILPNWGNKKQKDSYSFRSVKLHDFAELFTRLCWCFPYPFIKKLLSRMERDHWIGAFLRCWLFWENPQEKFHDFLG